jgi:hypothetical protein
MLDSWEAGMQNWTDDMLNEFKKRRGYDLTPFLPFLTGRVSGNTMVGTHINRNITWAEQAEPFMKYLARNSYMLQQGKFVADLAYLLDEGAPSTMPIWGSGINPAPPEGYDYDYINADVLILTE